MKNLFKKIWSMRAGYLMVAPLMLGILIFCYFPTDYGLLLSFTDKTVTSPIHFIGY